MVHSWLSESMEALMYHNLQQEHSCSRENPLSGGERRLQPSGVGPSRPEQPTPTPSSGLQWRGIPFSCSVAGVDGSSENPGGCLGCPLGEGLPVLPLSGHR